MYKRTVFVVIVLAIAIGIFSCGNHQKDVDVDDIKINLQFYPFYKDFSALDTNNLQQGLQQLKAKYPDFLDAYLDGLSNINMNGNYAETAVLKGFLTFPDFKNLFDTVNRVYPDTKQQDAAITQLFKHIKYYDSSIVLPEKVYYYAAALNHPVVVTQNNKILGVGIDCFLGRDFKPYEQVKIPYYLTIRNTKEYIPVAVALEFYNDKYPFNLEDKNLLQMMIDKGKEAYFLKKMLPNVDENLFFVCDKPQLDWCRKNEKLIYNFFIQKNLLYETDGQKIYRYVNNAPTSTGMPEESPGNTASYIGYRIVSNYAKNTGKSLVDILNDTTDAKTILSKANYKP